MAHAAGSEVADPDLTPLLDVVLQLIMFFMITANLVMEQVDSSIDLPPAGATNPIEDTSGLWILNVSKEGYMVTGVGAGKTVSKTPQEIEGVLNTRYNRERATLGEGEEVELMIVVRGDKGTKWTDVNRVLKLASKAGFKTVQLRAVAGR